MKTASFKAIDLTAGLGASLTAGTLAACGAFGAANAIGIAEQLANKIKIIMDTPLLNSDGSLNEESDKILAFDDAK